MAEHKTSEPGGRRRPMLLASILLGLFTAIGSLATLAVAADWLQGLETYFWEETSCTIESSRAVPRPEYGDHDFEVVYRYRHRGEELLGDEFRHGYAGSEDLASARVLASRYPEGSDVRCWVDPDNPERACLRRANLFAGFWILVPLLFVAVGGGSLWAIHRGPFRRGAAATPAAPSLSEKTRPLRSAGFMALFFGLFFLVGAGMLIPFFIWPVLRVAAARSWVEVPCEILSSSVRTHSGDDGSTYSVQVLFRYEIDGREHMSDRFQFLSGSSSGYERKAKAVERIPAGTRATCYVNPDDPFDAVLERGLGADYLFGLIPLLFALIGAGGLVFSWGAARAAKRDAARPSWGKTAVPRVDAVAAMEAEGPVSLEPAFGPFGKLGCLTLVALLWNGLVSVFVWEAVKGWRAGSPDWVLTIFISPFVLIGLLLAACIPYSILALANPRPRLRLSRGAIPLGGSAQIEWSFRGFSQRIRRLKIWLECVESTTRKEGSSRQTTGETTATVEIVDRERGWGLDYGSASFTLPEQGRPSGPQGERTATWKLKLRGEIAYWPDVLEEYEIRVLPADSG